MRRIFTHISAILCLVIASCSDQLSDVEQNLLGNEKIAFSANSARMVTKAGLQYTSFAEDTKYLLYGLESPSGSGNYDWNDMIMNDVTGVETESHLIDYGEDLYFNKRHLDFYGVTVCSTEIVPQRTDASASSEPVFSLALEDGVFPDLMYSDNLKNCNESMGLLDMNFDHALSKIHFDVVRQDKESLKGIRLKSISIIDTHRNGEFNIVTGKWAYGDIAGSAGPRVFYHAGEGSGIEAGTEPMPVTDPGGELSEMLIIPNEDMTTPISLKIKVVLTNTDGTEYSPDPYEIMAIDENGNPVSPYLFRKNHSYRLTLMIMTDGVRIITVSPMEYPWIVEEPELYMGQPITFGGLMWMDRNLGATSADCKKDWANTRGFYYQFGRNIPYIFDDEKFRNRSSSVNTYRTHGDKNEQLNIGYEYFFTYNEKGERIYGAVQGGTQTGHQLYMVDTLNIDGVRVGWEQEGGKWIWKGSYLGKYEYKKTPHYNSVDGSFSAGSFWNVDCYGKDGISCHEVWTESNGVPKWNGPGVTSSNIAINPGDPGIYHFISDARYYHDYFQSGAWCVKDCDAPNCKDYEIWRGMSLYEWNNDGSKYRLWSDSGEVIYEDIDENLSNDGTQRIVPTYRKWILDGCWETRLEDTEKVNYFWADEDGNPIPENHPCPKGWRIPAKEDFAQILPDHTLEHKWASEGSYMYVLPSRYGDIRTESQEAAIYGIDHNGDKIIYIIKNKGTDQCYRIRLKWIASDLKISDYYNVNDEGSMQYLEIARYPGTSDMSFDAYYDEDKVSVGSIMTTNTSQESGIQDSVRKMTAEELKSSTSFYTDYDWNNPSETLEIPICGFIYTSCGIDGMFGDGDMTILRCTDWSQNYDALSKIAWGGIEYDEGNYPYNEALNWCAYIRTDRSSGTFGGSRKCLGCQIRCVRDVNAN